MKPILLYDIDGTLLNVRREFLHTIIDEHLTALQIEKPKVDGRSFAGRTDRGIFMELLAQYPNREKLFERFRALYVKSMQEQLTSDKILRFDEAIESARIAKQIGYRVGLCTGNFEEVAYAKVKAAGLDGVFTFGGFGGQHENRNDLPQSADKNYRAAHGGKPSPDQYVIIGDTPNDIRCAKYFGAKVVAVTTGGFSKRELEGHQPDFVFKDLSNPHSWLEKL